MILDPTDTLLAIIAGLQVLQLGWSMAFQKRVTHLEDSEKMHRKFFKLVAQKLGIDIMWESNGVID